LLTVQDLTRGPVVAARRGAGVRTPADLALVSLAPFGRVGFAWLAAGKAAPFGRDLAAWAPLQAFDVTVFVRVDCRELVIARTGPGRPDCRWVLAEDVATDTLRVADTLWDDTLAALARQIPNPHTAGHAAAPALQAGRRA
jgi:hypothetical protein